MNVPLKDIVRLVKELPEENYGQAYERIKELSGGSNREDGSGGSAATTQCIACGAAHVSKNGKRHGKQAYICRDCGKSFVETSGSALAYSHESESVWKQVIADTVNGVSIEDTAKSLDLSHDCVFHMRHKMLKRLEDEFLSAQPMLGGICEADETYVLESVKGSKIPDGYHRKPRKHGAKASKPGLSSEYLCVCTGISGDGDCLALSVNRAMASKAEIEHFR
jgi:transposase-like protein